MFTKIFQKYLEIAKILLIFASLYDYAPPLNGDFNGKTVPTIN